ncbi:MAG: aldehyde dehydrogenase family protein [Hyphomonadaceae bacterium]
MYHAGQFYIDGKWVAPNATRTVPVSNPANEQTIAHVTLASRTDVDRAVAAAKAAFETYGATSIIERMALLERILDVYARRQDEIADIVSREMGAPVFIARGSHAPQGIAHLRETLAALKTFAFEIQRPTSRIVYEPIGVCGLITAWNWPMTLIACKVGPALAAGCTLVLKPSEVAPLCAHLFAEILDEAGVPPGVFNLIDGEGAEAGDALVRHPDVDMVSITASNAAGVAVAKAAAPTVKRVTQELGGKSACISLDDDDIEATAYASMARLCRNSGQSCAALTRLLVPARFQEEAARGAARAASEIVIGDPQAQSTTMGPVVNAAQFARIQRYIETGLAQGARLVAGGLGKPAGLTSGHFVRPTVFADVTPDMVIAQEEIFGPVLSIMPYRDEDDAVRIANGTVYGLSGAVRSADPRRAQMIGRRLRTGMVFLTDSPADLGAPFGGYRQSGNGREWGAHGLSEYLEAKVLVGGAFEDGIFM